MSEDMFDKNIQQLLEKSYHPAAPSAEFEQRLLDRMMREMQALPEPAEPSFRRWFREILALQKDSPRWWPAAAVADVIIIFLAFAAFLYLLPGMAASPPPPDETVQMASTPLLPVAEPDPLPPSTTEREAPPDPRVDEMIHLAAIEVGFEVQPAGLQDIARWTAPAEPAEFDASGAGSDGLMEKSLDQRPFDIGSVVDVLAAQIKKDMARKREVVLVLMLDESRNLARDRKEIAREIETRIRVLKKGMPKKRAARLELALVSFGSRPTLHLGPTADPAAVRKAIGKVKSDPSGKENVIEAVEFALRKIEAKGKQKVLLLLTDEEGTDTRRDALVDRALASLKKTQTRLYVFGKEARFQQRLVREWLRDEKGERIGPSEWVHRGIETARGEFFTPDWLFSPYTGRNIPAGFGSFVLSMLARQSGGAYYLMRDVPSEYDEAELVKYEPEWVNRKEYDARVSRSRLRASIRRIVEQWSKARPSHWLTDVDRVEGEAAQEIAKAERSAKLVERAIASLEATGVRSKEGPRWKANRDLTLAELYKFRFLLREYVLILRECVRDGFPRPEKRRKFNLYQICCDLKATAAHGGTRGERDLAKAKEALKRVAKEYKGTPWGDAAAHEVRYLSPLKIKPGFRVSPAKPKKRM